MTVMKSSHLNLSVTGNKCISLNVDLLFHVTEKHWNVLYRCFSLSLGVAVGHNVQLLERKNFPHKYRNALWWKNTHWQMHSHTVLSLSLMSDVTFSSSSSAYTSNADIIQPGLTPLQPNLDDFMDIPGTLPACLSVFLSVCLPVWSTHIIIKWQ